MRTSVLLPGVFLLVAASWRSTNAQTVQEGCCPTKTVRDAPAEVSELNGVYTLKSDEGSKPDPNCMDGCVYLRDNEEYCFVQKSTEEGATVVCEVSILSISPLSIDTNDFLQRQPPHHSLLAPALLLCLLSPSPVSVSLIHNKSQ